MGIEDQVHQNNLRRLIKVFGKDKEPHIRSRYYHQYHTSEEDPRLNGKLPEHVYRMTKETLESEL